MITDRETGLVEVWTWGHLPKSWSCLWELQGLEQGFIINSRLIFISTSKIFTAYISHHCTSLSFKMGHQDRNWLKCVGQRMPRSVPPSLFPSYKLPAFPSLPYSLCFSCLLHKLKTMPGSTHEKARGMVSCRHGYHPRTGMCAINHFSRH